jgi:hypothetical protein
MGEDQTVLFRLAPDQRRQIALGMGIIAPVQEKPAARAIEGPTHHDGSR